jgi:hypothetical protein
MKLKELNKNDLMDLLNYINDMKIDFRDELDLPKNLTFGLEIEFENALFYDVEPQVIELDGWKLKDDLSVTVGRSFNKEGGEITSPILIDKKECWDELKQICTDLKLNNAEATERCGGHIHIGSQVLKNDVNCYKNFLKLWYVYEEIMYRFSTGEDTKIRSAAKLYAKSLRPYMDNQKWKISTMHNEDELRLVLLRFTSDRYKAVNFSNTKYIKHKNFNTIEFRCPNGTIEEVIWQNNVNTFMNFANYAASNNFDKEFIDHQFKCDEERNIKYFYFMDIKKALELADLIFEKDLDKFYFLRQYFKDFDLKDNEKKFIK